MVMLVSKKQKRLQGSALTHLFALVLGSAALCASQVAQAYGVTIGYAQGHPEQLHGYKIAADWAWDWKIWETQVGALNGYAELSLFHLDSESKPYRSNQALSVVPMFRYTFANQHTVKPFVELGVGAAFLRQTRLAYRKLSTLFQFDDRLNIGLAFGQRQQYEISVGYDHMSNANIKDPNCGIDQKVLVQLRYWLDDKN
jgi:lipid A 3-O-deacylase